MVKYYQIVSLKRGHLSQKTNYSLQDWLYRRGGGYYDKSHNTNKTRMNCFRYLKLMSPLNAVICTTTYLERQKCYGRARKYYLENNYLTLRIFGMWVHDHKAVCGVP
jgi:hypothetical protein